jgi:hypothetical protein
MPYYYKDSLREASLIRAKNVLSKYEGYELIETRVEEVKNPSDLHKKGTVIERIRNKKDTLCIRVYWKTNQISKMIFGIEYKEADKLNLLCKTFDEHSSETPIYYEIKYLIKKRKWSRLNFEFEGQNIQVLSHQE